jgi:hypothetical protein
MSDHPESTPPISLPRKQQNRPIDEADFEQIQMFANCGLHWSGFQSWFGRPREEVRRYIFDAWPDLFRKIEVNDERKTRKEAYRKK